MAGHDEGCRLRIALGSIRATLPQTTERHIISDDYQRRSYGDTPVGFADFQPDGEGHLTQLRWTNEGYLLRKRESR